MRTFAASRAGSLVVALVALTVACNQKDPGGNATVSGGTGASETDHASTHSTSSGSVTSTGETTDLGGEAGGTATASTASTGAGTGTDESTGSATGTTGGGGESSCVVAEDCAWGEIDHEIHGREDCPCLLGCPTLPQNRETVDRRLDQYNMNCEPGQDGEGQPCPIDDCVPPPELRCVDHTCVP